MRKKRILAEQCLGWLAWPDFRGDIVDEIGTNSKKL
jgi:hypothetical protein